ncbi:DUF4166 domain-containing protein [Leucobacter sp. gxy201]|uniref:DUF4166 domain-containing protein n=1 Tax=Leucobacter sp. gxy201 TaxID=2957200 RepID=UPI003DA03D32
MATTPAAVLGPYEAALGARVDELHPRLRRYFSAIPAGSIGVGHGVFSVFGAARGWLRPLLMPFERRRALAAGRGRDVPFRIVNRSVPLGDGTVAARAERVVELPCGPWTMVDSVVCVGSRVVDRIGAPWTMSALFDAEVRGGALRLTSRAVGLVCGRFRVRLPRGFSPVVRLSEAYDDALGVQRVDLTVDAPLVGRIYAYRGSFTYEIVPEAEHD